MLPCVPLSPPTLFPRNYNGQGATTGYPFEFSSDSSEISDEVLGFELNTFTAVTSLELQFPAGDTYKFDVQLYDQEGELLHTEVVRALLLLVVLSASLPFRRVAIPFYRGRIVLSRVA